MNLTGILKSIILVVTSAAIWATPVTFIQLVGYGIALAGMFYYSLPPEGLGPQVQAFRAWVGEMLASDSAGESRLWQSARRHFAMTTRYESVPRHDAEEGQPKDAVA